MAAFQNPAEYTIEIQPWSGNYRPYRGVVRYRGQHIGVTGGCTTKSRAEAKAREIVQKHAARLEQEQG